jgi:hypothetical protein
LGLFLGGVGHDDAANGLFAFLETLNDETVVKRCDFHVTPRSGRGNRGAERQRDAVETGVNDETSPSIPGPRRAGCAEQDIC